MCKTSICLILLTTAISCFGDPTYKGFTHVGSFSSDGVKFSEYYLSNVVDERNVADARVGCHDGWKNGTLVAIETEEEHQIVRRLLSSVGITPATRVWTTGEYGGSTIGWIWFYYANGTYTPIENVGSKPWVNGVIPEEGCLSVGGRDLTYGWQSHDCGMKRRYVCEVPFESCCKAHKQSMN